MALKLSNFAGSGGGSSGGHIAKNSLFSNATLRVLDLISEGQIGGLVDGAKSVYFDDVPVQNKTGTYNFDNVSIDWVNGTQDQKVLKDFGDVVTPQQVGVEVRNGFPIVESIDNNEADQIRVIVSLPSLYSSDSKGNINATSVKVRFELALNNTGNWKQLGDFTISGKQNSQYQRSYTFDLPQKDENGERPTQWLIRMTRLSEDSSERYQARTIFDSIYVVSNSRLNYPHSALVGIKVNAENLASVPTRSYLIDGMIIKVPSNYDRETNTYNGIWDGTFKMEVSDNPAWILYALLTNERFGLGDFIKPEQINKAKLYEIGRYCDEEVDDGYGMKEKRFSINTQIQERADAYRVISDIAAVFRGMAFWAAGMTYFTCDMPTDASMLYTPSNVIDGAFTYSGSSRNDRHSVALVSWNDPEQNYKQVVEYVEDADLIRKWGIRQAELTAFGCTSRAQAIRAGRWILYTESYESDMITFNVGLDSALVLPGDVIKIQDPSYAGKRNGGRLVEAGDIYAVLDANVYLKPGNNTVISIRMPDGSFVERDVIVSYRGDRTRVEWNTPLETLPAPNAIWMISEASLVPITARVVNVTQGEQKNTYQITAVSHQPKKYDLIEKGIKFEVEPTANDPLDVEAPSNPKVEEVSTALGLGYVSSKLLISWLGGKNCVSYELEWRRENENETDWQTISTKSKSITLGDVQRGTYHFKLRGIGLMGNRTFEIYFYYLATGQYVTPLDVTQFEVIKRPSYLEVRWNPVEEASAYEVRCGTNWDSAEVITTAFSGTSVIHYQYEAGTYYYHIRSISATGEYSPNVTTYKLELNAPATPTDLTAIVSQSRIDFTWKSNKEDDLSHYEMREGQSWATGTKVAESKVNQMSIPGGSDLTRTFWLKAIALPKIYSDDAAWIKINVVYDDRRNIVITHNARALDWPSNFVYMGKAGNEIAMDPGEVHGEYITKIELPGEMNAQNSYFTVVTTSVKTGEDNETWETADFAWRDPQAKRAWRLGGDANTVAYENQIARHIGLDARTELEGFALEESLVSELGESPKFAVGEKYDWARYTKGLKLSDGTGVTWEKSIVKQDDQGGFRMSFWFQPDELESGARYMIVRFGNDKKFLAVDYTSDDQTFRLSSDLGEELEIPMELDATRYVFIAISQSKDTRTFGVGVLGADAQVVQKKYSPIGVINYLQIGTECV